MEDQFKKYILRQNFKSTSKCIQFLYLIGFSLEDSYKLSSELFDSKINITIEGLTKSELFFIECLNGCEIRIEKAKYLDSIFYIKNGKIWFRQDSKNERFWCSYDKVWSIFETKYQWDYKQIQAFIKNMLEKHLGLVELIPDSNNAYFDLDVGKTSRIGGVNTTSSGVLQMD